MWYILVHFPKDINAKGTDRPDFKVNEPNFKAPMDMAPSIKSS